MNNHQDDQLKRALEEGNLISIGQDLTSKETRKKPVSIPIDIRNFTSSFNYNLPIGIDFAKSINPINFLTTLEILDKILQSPKIPEKIKYKFENLQILLTNGKIAQYKDELTSFLKSEKKKVEKGEKGKTREEANKREYQLISLLTSLLFILKDSSIQKKTVVWASKKQFLELIDSENPKNTLREWKTKNYGKLPENGVFLSLISQNLIYHIRSLNLSEDLFSGLQKLEEFTITMKFNKIVTVLKKKLNLLVSPKQSDVNNLEESISIEKIDPDDSYIWDDVHFRILDTLSILLDNEK